MISGCMGIPISNNLERYLDMQVVHGRHSKQLYSEWLENFNKQMEGEDNVPITCREGNAGFISDHQPTKLPNVDNHAARVTGEGD